MSTDNGNAAGLTHLDEAGRAHMVNVSGKAVNSRSATARGSVHMRPETLELIAFGGHKKGDVLAVARIAGVMAAKKTGELIPLCHPLGIESASVDLVPTAPDRLLIAATVSLTGRTGVEMEALTAVSVAALTVYDMCKAVDKDMFIGPTWLEEKTGGRSGTYRRTDPVTD